MENYFEPNLTDDQLRAISSIGLALSVKPPIYNNLAFS